MSNRKYIVMFVTFFLMFIGIMDYPFISQMLNEIDQTEVARDYDVIVDNMDVDIRKKHLEEAREYNRALAEESALSYHAPFEEESLDEWYNTLLDIKADLIMASIEIPAIDVFIPIHHGTDPDVLEIGLGHLKGSSLPVGGENTHAVITGHRALPNNRLFTDLDQLENGDIFLIRVVDEILAYEVHEVQVVEPHQIEALKIEDGKDLVTLITCTPYGVNTHRIFVHGHRIPYNEAVERLTPPPDRIGFWAKWWWLILTILLLLWMIALVYWFTHKNNKENNTNNGNVDNIIGNQ